MFNMAKIVALGICIMVVLNCANFASVEFGFNDEGIYRGTLGQFGIRVLKIEAKTKENYSPLWEGTRLVFVQREGSGFASITEQSIQMDPGTYKTLRITVDSLCYVTDVNSFLLLDTEYQFTASSFSDITIDKGDELRLVIDIASPQWFDSDSMKIKTGHQAFEGAAVRRYY
uniref:DUF4382 domain-containing protein n=1 Tax=candidate division WOR-3 bacterium TaxID=2052148 RepID=A0A7C4X8Y5_UNCW3